LLEDVMSCLTRVALIAAMMMFGASPSLLAQSEEPPGQQPKGVKVLGFAFTRHPDKPDTLIMVYDIKNFGGCTNCLLTIFVEFHGPPPGHEDVGGSYRIEDCPIAPFNKGGASIGSCEIPITAPSAADHAKITLLVVCDGTDCVHFKTSDPIFFP
jgi:hypothetical protein